MTWAPQFMQNSDQGILVAKSNGVVQLWDSEVDSVHMLKCLRIANLPNSHFRANLKYAESLI